MPNNYAHLNIIIPDFMNNYPSLINTVVIKIVVVLNWSIFHGKTNIGSECQRA